MMRSTVSKNRFRAVASLAFLATAPLASAFTFEFGELKGSLDSTLSFGAAFRLNDPSPDLYGTTNSWEGAPGRINSVNGDDGDLNYGRGLYSTVAKGTHDLELKYGPLRGFFRGTYFRDFQNEDSARRTGFDGLARKRVVGDVSLLDAYLSYRFDAGGAPVDLRFGREVISWGESTFMPNGINAINPVDIARLRTPGSELREALKPVPMVSFSAGLSDTLTLEAFYQLAFKKTDIDPRGSYFSANDFAGFGGERVYLGFGSLADSGSLGYVPRGADRYGDKQGQYGVALRYLAENLGSTEFGLYYLNYHSRLPIISAITPSTPINTNLQGPLTAALIRSGMEQSAAATQAAGIWSLIVLSQTNPSALTPTQLATLAAPQTQALISGARSIAFLTSAATARYFIEYPEDIRLLGASFSTSLGRTGISLQGEVSLKTDQPLQVDDVELLFAALSSINPAYGPNNQIGNYLGQLSTEVSGYRRLDVWQGQVTASKVLPPMLGASQFVVLLELGAISVPDLPATNVLRFDGPGTYTGGDAVTMYNSGNGAFPQASARGFPDKFSWGYQVLARADYNNLFAGINVSPSLAIAHDVKGTTPLPLGNFVENRMTYTFGLEFNYQNAWSIDLRYVNFSGARGFNLLADRDYASATIKYSF